MITTNGKDAFNIWEHSATTKELYRKRCLGEAEEMTCHAQAAELLAPLAEDGDTLLDVGCGGGYFYHALNKRGIAVEYYGMDSAPGIIEQGRAIMPQFGLPAEHLLLLDLAEMNGHVDHVVCLNVLSNLDNFHRPLERLLLCAGKSVILRESAAQGATYRYVKDKYLDEDVDLKVHVNAYDTDELMSFMESYGFQVERVVDRRTGGEPELVIDYPHWWTFFVARKAG